MRRMTLGLIALVLALPAHVAQAVEVTRTPNGVEPVSASSAIESGVESPRVEITADQVLPGRWLSTSAGGTACAVLNSGQVECWGAASDIISGARSIRDAVGISVDADIGSGGYGAYDVACALLQTGTVSCWGDNAETNRAAQELTGVVDLDVGGAGACFVLTTGRVTCLLNPGYRDLEPQIAGATRVSVGTYAVCAVNNAGTVDCEGSDWLGHVSGPESTSNVVDVGAGDHLVCVLTRDGVTQCWGLRGSGETSRDARNLSVGVTGGCAVTSQGRISCWYVPSEPLQSLTTDPVLVAVGWGQLCGLERAGTVVCWSDASGDPVVSGAVRISNVRTSHDGSGDGIDPSPIDADAPELMSSNVPRELKQGDVLAAKWRAGDASGVSSIFMWVENAAGQTVSWCPRATVGRESGTAIDGWYSRYCVVPADATSGSYSVRVQFTDVKGNSSALTIGLVEITAAQADEDVNPPEIMAVDLPREVNQGDVFTARWRASDSSGVSESALWIEGTSGSSVYWCPGVTVEREGGTAIDGWYSRSCLVPATAITGNYNVYVELTDLAGNTDTFPVGTFRLVATEPEIVGTGKHVITRVSSSASQVSKGATVRLSGTVQELYTDGSYQVAEDGTRLSLQARTSGAWRTVASLSARGGQVTTSVSVNRTSRYRFVLSDGTASQSVRIKVVKPGPDEVVVRWPNRVVNSFVVKVTVRSDGSKWTRQERVSLLVKPSGQSEWKTLVTRKTRNGKVVLRTKRIEPGTWRVVVSGRGIEDSKVYGVA